MSDINELELKMCKKCGLEKPLDEFFFNKQTGKIRTPCKACWNKRLKDWCQSNHDKVKNHRRKTYSKKKPTILVDENGIRQKTCIKCGVLQPLENFGLRNVKKGYMRKDCKSCQQQSYDERRSQRPISNTKVCTKCGIEKSIEEFSFQNKALGSRESRCKTCRKRYCIDNYDDIYKRTIAWMQANPDKVKASSIKTRTKNKAKILAYQNEYSKKRKKTDPAYRLRRKVSVSVKEALKRTNSQKNGSILKHLPYSFQELKSHLEKQFEPWMTWDNNGRYNSKTWDDNDPSTWTWHVDHIIPQSDLPYTSMEEENFKKCWALENLRPYPAKWNQSDGGSRVRHTTKRGSPLL